MGSLLTGLPLPVLPSLRFFLNTAARGRLLNPKWEEVTPLFQSRLWFLSCLEKSITPRTSSPHYLTTHISTPALAPRTPASCWVVVVWTHEVWFSLWILLFPLIKMLFPQISSGPVPFSLSSLCWKVTISVRGSVSPALTTDTLLPLHSRLPPLFDMSL